MDKKSPEGSLRGSGVEFRSPGLFQNNLQVEFPGKLGLVKTYMYWVKPDLTFVKFNHNQIVQFGEHPVSAKTGPSGSLSNFNS